VELDDALAGHAQCVTDRCPCCAFLACPFDELRAVLPCVSELSEFVECGHALIVTELTDMSQEFHAPFWGVNACGRIKNRRCIMAVVVGNLATFGLESASVGQSLVEFIPDQPAVTGTKYLLTAKPVTVPVAADGSGAFTVNLAPSDSTTPGTFYRIRVTSLDGNFVFLDLPDWRLYVPVSGGELASLLRSSLLTNAAMVWTGPSAPENPAPGTGWLVTDPNSADYGWYMEWSN
jgi:hypothetical protein